MLNKVLKTEKDGFSRLNYLTHAAPCQRNKEIISKRNKSVLVLGVGGVSMSQLALALKNQDCKVLGFDNAESATTQKLAKQGIEIYNKISKRFFQVDYCIKTAAIKDDSCLVKQLKTHNIPIFDRAVALGELLKTFKNVIAVAGTHGKSTTSALIYEILRVAGKNVSCHIGADVFLSRFQPGDEFVVVEACEFNKSFLQIIPNIAVVTNVEPEHLDCYGNFKNLQNAFATFIKRAKTRYAYCEKSTEYLKRYKNIKFVSLSHFKAKLKGEYNQKNISLASKVCKDLGVDEKIINQVVESFTGLPRRYEFLGFYGKTKIFIDYAHHPTEVKAFVSTFKQEHSNSLIIFQPHTYSRTKAFLKEFVELFANCGKVCIFKEYPAREQKKCGVDAKTLSEQIRKVNDDCFYACSDKKIDAIINNFEAVAFVGAGDVCKLAYKLVNKSK